jgi:hypothetical protein
MSPIAAALLETFVAMSVFYVWVVRYQAVLADFKSFGLPDTVRDLVGAAKLTAAFLLLGIGPIEGLEVYGAGAIAFFMAVAVVMHIRIKNPVVKMLPSMGLGLAAVLVMLHHMG